MLHDLKLQIVIEAAVDVIGDIARLLPHRRHKRAERRHHIVEVFLGEAKDRT